MSTRLSRTALGSSAEGWGDEASLTVTESVLVGPRQKPAQGAGGEQVAALFAATFERAHRDDRIEAEESGLDDVVGVNDQERAILHGSSDSGISVQGAQSHACFPELPAWVATEDDRSRSGRPSCEVTKTRVVVEGRHRHLQGESSVDEDGSGIGGIHAVAREQ